MFAPGSMAANRRKSAAQRMKTALASIALLAGPYHPPALRRGDRAFCLFRDCDVVVTSWTDARISWPRCRVIDQAGGSGRLVDEELARAVRTESALAIHYWWGASHDAVKNWRRALGIKRLDTLGTVRLRREVTKKIIRQLKDKKLPARLVKQRRDQAIRLNLIRFTKGHRHPDSPLWTAKELALLGTDADELIAQQIGRTANAVRIMRDRQGIRRKR